MIPTAYIRDKKGKFRHMRTSLSHSTVTILMFLIVSITIISMTVLVTQCSSRNKEAMANCIAAGGDPRLCCELNDAQFFKVCNSIIKADE